MTEHNHRRGTRRKRYPGLTETERPKDPDLNYHAGAGCHDAGDHIVTTESAVPLHNGYVPRNGRAYGYIDKSLHGWGRRSELADKSIGASIGNDFANGARGMAKAVRGAKKFVRSRIRFHEKAATKKLIDQD